MPRAVSLSLLDVDGQPVGALPPVDLELPWTTDVVPVIAAARDRYGLDIQVLRLLSVQPTPDGAVSYLGQLSTPAVSGAAGIAAPAEIDLSDDPRRAPYARPGGPAASVAWGTEAAERLGLGPVLAVDQRRTWNLSAIWRLRTPDAPLWIKHVPHFFAHEPAVLRWLGASDQRADFPLQLASDGGRMLLADIPGVDLHEAPVAVRQAIAARLHPTQLAAAAQVPALLAAGVPDRRLDGLRPNLEAVAESARLANPDLDRLVGGLADRFAAVAECGLPDTLVHGDLHPGNVRAAGDGPYVIIDWGDSFIGNPAFDVLRLVERLPRDDAAAVIAAWAARWRADVPGSDPQRAADLLRPVAALRLASVYVDFLANIEPSEHVYHADDPAMCLAAAAGFAAEELAAAAGVTAAD